MSQPEQPSANVYVMVLTNNIDENATRANTESTLWGWMEDDDCRWALRQLVGTFEDDPDAEPKDGKP